MERATRVTLVATYELGRQPFGLASPAAWLQAAGFGVITVDLSREPFRPQAFESDLVAFHLPMHTATRRNCRNFVTRHTRRDIVPPTQPVYSIDLLHAECA